MAGKKVKFHNAILSRFKGIKPKREGPQGAIP